MKKFILQIALFVTIISLILVVLFFSNHSNTNSYNYAYKHKIELLETTPSPRMIVVGGSSVAFGVDSYYLEEHLNINVINIGLHAGLGLKFILTDLTNYIQKGDIVLLMPEYAHFYDNGHLGGNIINDILFLVDISKIKNLGRDQYLTFVSNTPQHIKSRILNTAKKFLVKDYKNVYQCSSFNDKGDVVGHFNYPSKPFIQIGHCDESKFTNYIYEFIGQIRTIEQKGASVILYPCAIPDASYQNIQKNIERVTKILATNHIHFVVPPADSHYPDSLFFDTPYHLNKQGIELRSKEIVNNLSSKIH